MQQPLKIDSRPDGAAPDVLPLAALPETAGETPQRAAGGAESTPPPCLLLTSDEVAALLRVSRRALERWASAGRVPGRVQLPGRAIRWNRQTVLDWIAAGCPAPARPRRGR